MGVLALAIILASGPGGLTFGLVTGTARSGSGGAGADGSKVQLAEAVRATTTGDVTLVQHATAGSGGRAAAIGGPGGAGGLATSRLQQTVSSSSLDVDEYYALTGEWISGKEAAAIELINFSHPLEELDDRVQALAEKLTTIPLTQLISMKLVVNQAYDNMGLQGTQTLGPILDGIMRNTPEGREFVRVAASEGVRGAITRRDGPFRDYSQAPPEERPRKRSELR